MELIDEKFSVQYDASNGKISCKGIMDLREKKGYQPLANLFDEVVEQSPQIITLDIRQLEFLNSTGITVIGSGLVIKIRNKALSKLVIHCSKDFPWQSRSMKGISKLMSDIELRFD